jgi:phage tail-like protein
MRRGDWLVGQLPMGMLDDDFFVRFVSLFQDLATSFLEDADNISNVVDVTVAPPDLVRWLASWIARSHIDSSLDEQLQRTLVRRSSEILAWRGTRFGLERFLEAITGSPPEIEDAGGIVRGDLDDETPRPAPFVRIRVGDIGWLPDKDFVSLVEDEVPAGTAYELFVGDRLLWPAQKGEPRT